MIEAIVEGLTSPANIMIQKNFVAREVVNKPENVKLTAEMMVLWQQTLKILVTDLSRHRRYEGVSNRKFIPGIIYSDECLGVYMPADSENRRPYATVAVNPITIAAAVNPKAFNQKLSPHKESEAFQAIPTDEEEDVNEKKSDSEADTPINRVSKLLFHIGLHELCHLLYPDSWGNEEFHKNITYMEILCQNSYPKIRDEVKTYMRSLRSKSAMLISQIARSKKKMSEGVVRHNIKPFTEWLTQR
jgi:hypothetical protein